VRRNEDRFDRDQIVDQIRFGHGIVEPHGDDAGLVDDVDHAHRAARTTQRLDDVRAGERIGEEHGSGDDHGRADLRVSDDGLRRARVIAVGRNAAWIVADDETEPRLASLRKGARHTMLAPGDLVDARAIADDRVVVDSVAPRDFTLMRRAGNGRTKTMAANVDTVAVVAALVDPPLHTTMIDQLVAFAAQHEIAPLLLLTKADLAGEEAAERIAAIYRAVDVPTIVLQPKTGRGIEQLRVQIASRRALLVGNSGVGKSSIFRALGGIAVVGDLSRFGRGRQTTTSARLARLGDGFLIDSPGIGEFGLDPMSANEIGWLFVEMREPATRCRFANCRHLSEPGCAVRKAVDEGRIAPSRYASYVEIVASATAG
jgi:ribosome biogenesis GTPase